MRQLPAACLRGWVTWLRPGDPSPSACSLLGSARSLTGLPGGLHRSGKCARCQRPNQALRHVPWRLITQQLPTRSSGFPLLGLRFLSRHPSGPGDPKSKRGRGPRAPGAGWDGHASRESESRIEAQGRAPSAGPLQSHHLRVKVINRTISGRPFSSCSAPLLCRRGN